MNKRQLYESIMMNVAKQVKKTLNEGEDLDEIRSVAPNVKNAFSNLREMIYDGGNLSSSEEQYAASQFAENIFNFADDILAEDDALIGKLVKKYIKAGIDEYNRCYK